MKLKELIALANKLSIKHSVLFETIQQKALLYLRENKTNDEDSVYATQVLNQPIAEFTDSQFKYVFKILEHCATATINPATAFEKFMAITQLKNTSLFQEESSEIQDLYSNFIEEATQYAKQKKSTLKKTVSPTKKEIATSSEIHHTTISSNKTAGHKIPSDKESNSKTLNNSIKSNNYLLSDLKDALLHRTQFVPIKTEKQNQILQKEQTISTNHLKALKLIPHLDKNDKSTQDAPKAMGSMPTVQSAKKDEINELQQKLQELQKKLIDQQQVLLLFHQNEKDKAKKITELETLLNHRQDIQPNQYIYQPSVDGNIIEQDINNIINYIVDDLRLPVLHEIALKSYADNAEKKQMIDIFYIKYQSLYKRILFDNSYDLKKIAASEDKAETDAARKTNDEINEEFLAPIKTSLLVAFVENSSAEEQTKQKKEKDYISFAIEIAKRIEHLKPNSTIFQLAKRYHHFIQRNYNAIMQKARHRFEKEVVARFSHASELGINRLDEKDVPAIRPTVTTTLLDEKIPQTPNNLGLFSQFPPLSKASEILKNFISAKLFWASNK